MLTISRVPRHNRGLWLLLICLLALSTLPVAPAAAAKITKPLDDKLPEFTRGTLQRTSLSTFKSSSFPSDTKGAVQLIPVSVVKSWLPTAFTLDTYLSDLSAVAIDTSIFVLGGLASDGASVPEPTAEVWSTQINPLNGAPISDWHNETLDLPNVQHAEFPFNGPVAARSAMAATAVQTGPNSGYIYVMGGRVSPPGANPSITSYTVSIAKVENGHITNWTSSNSTNLVGLRIPTDAHSTPWGLNGLQSASAVSQKVGNNTYVYLIGGLERFRNGGSTQEVGSSQVYYAKVDPANGMLMNPNTNAIGWATAAPLPIPTTGDMNPNVAGLWDATAVSGHFVFETTRDVLYVTGGQYQSGQGNPGTTALYNSVVYRAFIESNGSLTWTSTGANAWEGNLPQARVGMGGVEVNGKLYLTGGRQISNGSQGTPEAAVLTSLVEEDFKLLEQGTEAGSNFIYQSDALKTPISPRARHGSVKVQVPVLDAEAEALAYVYVIAGQGDTANGTNSVIYAKVGGDEDVASLGFASSGWYYSTIHETNRNFTSEQVQQIDWTTDMPVPAMDIELQYRISVDNDCENPVDLPTAPWVNAYEAASPKRSVPGANSFVLNNPTAHCFQYRAKLTNGSSTIQTTTPSLLNVSIQVIVPGSPDLKVKTLTDLRNGKGHFTGLNVVLQNHYEDASPDNSHPTQSADVEQKGGSFFVDLVVFGPDDPNVETPTPPWTTNPTGDKACAVFPKNQMGVDAEISVLHWYDISDTTCDTDLIEIRSLFPEPGDYVIFIVVDGLDCSPDPAKGCVDESSPFAEDNNVKRLNITITGVGPPDIYMPIIFRS